MELSIIVPALNEIAFIDRLVHDVCSGDKLNKEVLIADGGSTDGTRERIAGLQKIHPELKLIDNPMKTSTHGFNIAFGHSSGRYIAFVGAHAEYNEGYFRSGIEYLERGECDVVGGPLKQAGKNDKAAAIAIVMSSKLGVGNTEFRTQNKKMYVDSVAFAIYSRIVVETCGLMDESLPVNQDDEFHYRIKKHGFRILMVPEMQATYYVRDSYSKLFRQYFRYGLYKPAVLKKVRGSVRMRHLVPSLFTLYIMSLPFCLLFPLWIFPLLLYLIIILLKSLMIRDKWKIKFLALPVFPVLHLAYGSGFLLGIFRLK